MLIDATHAHHDAANAAADFLCKSVEDALLFDQHPTSPLLGQVENFSTAWVEDILHRLQVKLLTVLVTGSQLAKAVVSGEEGEQCREVERLAREAPPGSLTLDDYLTMLDCLMDRYLPAMQIASKAKRHAVQQYLAGKLRQAAPADGGREKARTAMLSALGLSRAQAGRAVKMTPLDQGRMEVAKASAGRLIQDLRSATRSKVQKIIIDAERTRIETGHQRYKGQPLQQALSDAFGELNRDWRRVAVTETAVNASDGYLASLLPGEKVKWLPHPGACRYCESMRGRVFEVVPASQTHKDPETQVWVGKYLMNYGRAIAKRKRLADGTLADRDADELVVPAIPAHPTCLLPGQVVTAGKVSAVMQSVYEGLVIELRTDSGRHLSVTENHPILTPAGFLPAKFLREGDNVFRCSDPQGVASAINPDGYQAETTIDDLFRAFCHAHGMPSRTMKPSAEYFYGDGRFMNEQIQVVFSQGLLRGDRKSSGSEAVEQVSLSGRSARAFSSSSWCHACFEESLAKGRPTHSDLSREFLFRFSGTVQIQDLLRERGVSQFWARHARDGAEFLSHGHALGDHFFARGTGDRADHHTTVSLDRVASIRTQFYAGHVYDLTEDNYGLYTCNNIVVKNCRCVWVPHVELTEAQKQRLSS